MKRFFFLYLVSFTFLIEVACDNQNFQEVEKDMIAVTMESVSSKKILLVLTSNNLIGNSNIPTGYWLKEAALPWKIFTEAGIQVNVASPKGGPAPVDENSRNYMDSTTQLVAKNPAFISSTNRTIPLSEINANDYDGVFYVGGHGPLWDFPENEDITRITTQLYEKNKAVAAVCHGQAALINVKLSNGNYLVEGHSMTSITNEEERAFERTDLIPFFLETSLIEKGAKFIKAAPWTANIEISGNLITGQNPSSAEGVAQAMVTMIQEREPVISESRFWKLMQDICDMGNFIVAVPSDGASANILGTFKIKYDGKENVLQVANNKDHIHIYPNHLSFIEFTTVDVGYGPEPCMKFINHHSDAFLKLYYMGGGKSEKQQQLIKRNSDLESLFKGKW